MGKGEVLEQQRHYQRSPLIHFGCLPYSVTEITLAEGLNVSTDTVINPLYNLKANIKLPAIHARHLKPANEHTV
jgi:hypothetical protein